jgi:hypothetical protein
MGWVEDESTCSIDLPRMLNEYGEFSGMRIGRGNRGTRRRLSPVPLCPRQIPCDDLGFNPRRRGWKPATKRLNYGVAYSISKKHE